MTTIMALLALAAALPNASPVQDTHTAAAKEELRRLDAERRVARQRLRVAREQDLLDAAKAELPAPATNVQARDDAPPAPGASPDAAMVAPTPKSVTTQQFQQAADVQQLLAARQAAQDFGKLGFGAGLSLTIDLGTKDRIAEAQIVKGIVRVTDQNNAVARLLLETHYLFKPAGDGPFGLAENMWGVGPFVAVQPGEDRIIEALGFGLMVAFRREETKTDSFNIGVGVMIDPNTRVLGDGFVANAAPPNGEEEVRYRETAQKGLMLMTSFSF
jgi:hypothetical protein